MTQLILISVVGLLIGNTVADVLVQPGYGQPSPSLLPHPFSTLPRAASPGLLQPHGPGYHLELHPVYGHLGQSTGGLGYLPGHDLLPSLSKPGYRRPHFGGLRGFGLPGAHGIIPGIPVPAPRRFRRSIGELSGAGELREKRDGAALATKSTLNEDNPTVVDLFNQDTEEKHVEARHSKNAQARSASTLLGLNPSSMYPVQHQYRFAMPTYGSYQQIVNTRPEITGQMNARASTQEQATATSAQNTIPQINPANLQHAMLLQQPYQQTGTSQTAVQDQQRNQKNYPDPRPVTATQFSTKAQKNDRNKLKNAAASQDSKIEVPTDDQEIVGSSAGHDKLRNHHTHIHHHGKFIPRSNIINEAYTTCGCSNPSYTVYNGNDETANNLAFTQLGFQQPAEVYQLEPVQENYPPNSGHVALPQTYSNPIVSYQREYPAGLTGSYYMQEGNTLPVGCQLG